LAWTKGEIIEKIQELSAVQELKGIPYDFRGIL